MWIHNYDLIFHDLDLLRIFHRSRTSLMQKHRVYFQLSRMNTLLVYCSSLTPAPSRHRITSAFYLEPWTDSQIRYRGLSPVFLLIESALQFELETIGHTLELGARQAVLTNLHPTLFQLFNNFLQDNPN